MSADDHIRKMAEHAKDPGRFSKDQLKAFVERIERDVAHVVRQLLTLGVEPRKSEEMILETYLGALGMLD